MSPLVPPTMTEPSVSFVDQPDHERIELRTIVDNEPDGEDDGDIYRGRAPSTPRPGRSDSVSSSSSSSSSSSASTVGGPLGALAAVVERAITRWARANWSTSSLDSDSDASSSKSSFRTTNKSVNRRRKRNPSLADLNRANSEREVAARIRAREERRYVEREFSLYLPPALSSSYHPSSKSPPTTEEQRTTRTTSLPSVLSKLDAALKRSSKARRPRNRPRPSRQTPLEGPIPILPHLDYMLPDAGPSSRPESATELPTLQKVRKGKQRVGAAASPDPPTPGVGTGTPDVSNQQAWWLDVASPTWEDMRAMGKLLHMHPLTLEDILQQEPREKLELFPKLGYYFIVFRAIESQGIPQPTRDPTTDAYLAEDEGHVAEVYVYLVVFPDGICSFHFSDISEHTERVRSKIRVMEKSINMSSAWIAHGILDSIVDAFFPYVGEIEEEIITAENTVFSDSNDSTDSVAPQPIRKPRKLPVKQLEKAHSVLSTLTSDEKGLSVKEVMSVKTTKTRFSVPRPTFALSYRRWKRTVHRMLSKFFPGTIPAPDLAVSPTTVALRRMARTRRLVTTLSRVLVAKSEVVARLQKRLGDFGQTLTGREDDDLVIYMGDVQDHIITLQQSLAHYERMLSQSHPTYLQNLRVTASRGRSGTDKAIMVLTVVSIAVMPAQIIIGLFSTNIHIPTNLHLDADGNVLPGYPYYVFGAVVVGCFLVLCAYGCTVRWWWINAKRKRRTVL